MKKEDLLSNAFFLNARIVKLVLYSQSMKGKLRSFNDEVLMFTK